MAVIHESRIMYLKMSDICLHHVPTKHLNASSEELKYSPLNKWTQFIGTLSVIIEEVEDDQSKYFLQILTIRYHIIIKM
ncbi:hypothetical protein QTP88_018133 [Uroleucon formosanum]